MMIVRLFCPSEATEFGDAVMTLSMKSSKNFAALLRMRCARFTRVCFQKDVRIKKARMMKSRAGSIY